MTPDAPFGQLAAALFVSGVGQSMILVPLIVGVLGATPAALNGKISPIITLSVQLGGSIASAVSIAFFDRRMALHSDAIAAATTPAHLNLSGTAASTEVLARLAGIVTQQSSTMGFADTILAIAAIAAFVTPTVLAFPRVRQTA